MCQSEIEEADERLNMDTIEQSDLEDEHIPYGVPTLTSHTACLLHQQDYITGYSHDMKIPLFTAATIKLDQVRHYNWEHYI